MHCTFSKSKEQREDAGYITETTLDSIQQDKRGYLTNICLKYASTKDRRNTQHLIF